MRELLLDPDRAELGDGLLDFLPFLLDEVEGCIAPAQFERRMMSHMFLIAPLSDCCVAWRLPFELFDRPTYRPSITLSIALAS